MHRLTLEQHSSILDGSSDILVAEDIVHAASRGEVTPSTFKSFDVLAKGCRRVDNGLFQRVACRKATLNIRKPDAERAVGLFFNNRYVLCRHVRK